MLTLVFTNIIQVNRDAVREYIAELRPKAKHSLKLKILHVNSVL